MIKYLKNEEDFLDLTAKGCVLVDFFAEWCGPCKIMGEILETVDADILKVNTDEFPNLAQKFGINGFPTFILLKDGEKIAQFVGFHEKSQLLNRLMDYIK